MNQRLGLAPSAAIIIADGAASSRLFTLFIFFPRHFLIRVTQRTVDQLIATENSGAWGFMQLAKIH